VLTAYDKKKYTFHKNTHVIENPLILQNKHHNVKRENIILAVGRLHPVKGFDLLIEAFSKLKTPKDWKIVILGEGPEKENLNKLIAKSGLKNKITLAGAVSDIEYYYKKSSIFALSSRAEGFPIGLCEAMGYGCAPIAFDCLTGPREIIENNQNGILIEAENIQQLTSAMQNLINDKQKRIALAKNAVTLYDRLAIDKISAVWFKLINNVIKQQKSS
jgi:glycosyltransferase involved in cell wall biosynthesis